MKRARAAPPPHLVWPFRCEGCPVMARANGGYCRRRRHFAHGRSRVALRRKRRSELAACGRRCLRQRSPSRGSRGLVAAVRAVSVCFRVCCPLTLCGVKWRRRPRWRRPRSFAREGIRRRLGLWGQAGSGHGARAGSGAPGWMAGRPAGSPFAGRRAVGRVGGASAASSAPGCLGWFLARFLERARRWFDWQARCCLLQAGAHNGLAFRLCSLLSPPV